MVSFRWAQASDAGLVHSITQDAWAEYRSLPGSSSAFDESQDQIYETLSNGTLAVLGFIDQRGVLSVRLQVQANTIYISRMGVRPSYQGRGYARQALDWIEQYAKSQHIGAIQCTVRAALTRNRHLYESQGFCKIKEQFVHKNTGVALEVWTMQKFL